MKRFLASNEIWLSVLLALTGWFTPMLSFADKLPLPQSGQVARLVSDLDAADFFARESATRRLRSLVIDPQSGPTVAAELERASLDAGISYEAQELLAEVLRGVEPADAATTETLSVDATTALIKQLGDDRFTVRETAARRLHWLLRNDANIVPILQQLKSRLGDPHASAATRQEFDRHFDEARRAWLLAAPEKCPLPAVEEDQISTWCALVGKPTDNEATFAAQRVAQRELEDLLVRDDYRDRVARAIEAEHTNTVDPAGLARLRDLVDLTRPAMVAEIWSATRFINWIGGVIVADGDPYSVHLATTQYLHVGIPQIPEGALRATHFDRCDDKLAHCVSGNTLQPGDYPVGTAFPHPEGDTTLFHLVNLPTPRRRLIYEYSSRRSESVRLRELSQRTCDAFLNQERKLIDADVMVLMLLDRAVVANFAGQFFAKIDDKPLDGLGSRLMIGHTTTHGGICYALAFTGTKDAASGLIKAIADKRMKPPENANPYNLPIIALLAIANRDPWQDANQWLAEQVDHDDLLINNVDPGPELAATAAAILTDRLGQSPQSLGLIPVHDGFCQQVGLTPYRFESVDHRAAARAWIKAQRKDGARDKAG